MPAGSFTLSQLQNEHSSCEIGNRLQKHGYLKLYLDCNSNLSADEKWCVQNWESVYRDAFYGQSDQFKTTQWPMFSTVKGYTVGYRVDGKREFLETRLSNNSTSRIEPEITLNSPEITERYVHLVKTCVKMYHRIGKLLLACVAETLGVDNRYFFDLIDDITDDSAADDALTKEISDNLSVSERSESSKSRGECLLSTDMLSSSLLRICNYPLSPQVEDATAKIGPIVDMNSGTNSSDDKENDNGHDSDNNIAFGAHTDVSLLTLGMCASCPGLEMLDLNTQEWVRVEKDVIESLDTDGATCTQMPVEGEVTHAAQEQERGPSRSPPVMSVFVGDILQLLTRSVFRATAHRVVIQRSSLRDSSLVFATFPAECGGFSSETGGSTLSPVVTAPDSSAAPTAATTALSVVSRVSCPYILRGRHPAVIPPLAAYSRFPASLASPSPSSPSSADSPPTPSSLSSSSSSSSSSLTAVLSSPHLYPELPDLEGSSMKLLHKLLDLKRQKCLRENNHNPSHDWVLSAYKTT